MPAPAASAASAVCLDGKLKPSGSISHAAAGGRGLAIIWDRPLLTAAPPTTTRNGTPARHRFPLRAAATAAKASAGYTAAGSASALTARATLVAVSVRRSRMASKTSRSASASQPRSVAHASPATAANAADAAASCRDAGAAINSSSRFLESRPIGLAEQGENLVQRLGSYG